jgi:FkbM family methyltransferase
MSIQETWLTEWVEASSGKSLAVDVGANRGEWTRLLAESGFTRVIAIEPDPRASCHIQESDTVEVVSAAVSSEERERLGDVVLYLRPSPDQNSLLESHPIGSEAWPTSESAVVRCVSMKTICPEGADFVKVDVEGAECEVLSSCTEDGTWDRCTFLVECHDTIEEVLVELKRLRKSVTVVPHPFYPMAHPGHCWAVGVPQDQ